MKRFLAVLLSTLMLLTFAQAEAEDDYTPITAPEELWGAWTVCAAHDSMPYLILRPDGTFAAYDYWQFDLDSTTGDDLIRQGTYTFDPADSSLTLEGIDTMFTAKTGAGWDGLTSVDSLVEATPDSRLLLLEGFASEDDDRSMLYLHVEDLLLLLPLQEELCGCEWQFIDTPNGTLEANTNVYIFGEDGQVIVRTSGNEDAGDTLLPYTYDKGLLQIAGDPPRHLLLQYHYLPVDGADVPAWYDLAQAEAIGSSTALTRSVLVVHDLDSGSLYYLTRSDG